MENKPTQIKEHTTHFDDCGCLSARFQAELSHLEESRGNHITMKNDANKEVFRLQKENAKLRVQVEKLETALEKIAQIHGENGNCENPKCNCGLPDWDIAKEALSESGKE